MRMMGLEPIRHSTHAPQTCLSANSSTSARYIRLFTVLFALPQQKQLYMGIRMVSSDFLPPNHSRKPCVTVHTPAELAGDLGDFGDERRPFGKPEPAPNNILRSLASYRKVKCVQLERPKI